MNRPVEMMVNHCPCCKEVLDDEAQVDAHSPNKLERLGCEVCGRLFDDEQRYWRHRCKKQVDTVPASVAVSS